MTVAKKKAKAPAFSAKLNQFRRDIGYRRDESERLIQPRFYLGSDETQAIRRAAKLEELWEMVVANHDIDLAESVTWSETPVWEDDSLLLMAKALAKGEYTAHIELPVDYLNDMEGATQWLGRLNNRYPILRTEFQDQRFQLIGQSINTLRAMKARTGILPKRPQASGPTLHEALQAYSKHILATKILPPNELGERKPTQHAAKDSERVLRLVERHADMPLSQFNATAIEGIVTYWSNRPPHKTTGKPLAIKTCTTHITTFKMFVRWLNRSDAFGWTRPANLDLSELRPKLKLTDDELDEALTAQQVETYSIEELTTLYRYATPLERALIVISLNCGFANAEIAGLTTQPQIKLRTAHNEAKRMGIDSTAQDSWIERIRRKNSVFGIWKLWPETVQAIEWSLHRRHEIEKQLAKKKIKVPNRLFVTELGQTFDAVTKSNNNGAKVAKFWNRLLDRIQVDQPTFKRLGFKHLRKTSGNLIKSITNSSEIASVFLAHGTPYKGDELIEVYTNRLFRPVFEALDKMRDELRPMFESKQSPFPIGARSAPNISLEKIEKIRRLSDTGLSDSAIGREVGVSSTTVRRWIDRGQAVD